MKLSNDALLTQLKYNVTENTLKDLDIIKENTNGFENIKNHIVALNDHLKNFDGFVAMSSTHPYLKIKIISNDKELIKKAHDEINKWAEKYKVKIEKVEGKETYYILGIK